VTGSRRKTTTEAPPREELLDSSPFDGDLAEELAAAPRPRRKLPSVTVLLGAGVLLVAGFTGGIQADKHWGAAKTPDPAALINQFRGGGQGGGGGQGLAGRFGGSGRAGTGQGGTQGGAGQGGTQGGAGDATTGTVKLVDGDIVYVQTPGGVVRVKTSGSTKVTIAKKVKLKDLKAGASVVVRGTAGQDGTVTATSVGPGN
jgi:hypothetical protein